MSSVIILLFVPSEVLIVMSVFVGVTGALGGVPFSIFTTTGRFGLFLFLMDCVDSGGTRRTVPTLLGGDPGDARTVSSTLLVAWPSPHTRQ